jgi:hypothetical protein
VWVHGHVSLLETIRRTRFGPLSSLEVFLAEHSPPGHRRAVLRRTGASRRPGVDGRTRRASYQAPLGSMGRVARGGQCSRNRDAVAESRPWSAPSLASSAASRRRCFRRSSSARTRWYSRKRMLSVYGSMMKLLCSNSGPAKRSGVRWWIRNPIVGVCPGTGLPCSLRTATASSRRPQLCAAGLHWPGHAWRPARPARAASRPWCARSAVTSFASSAASRMRRCSRRSSSA